jgi:hypothetical protein
VKGGLLEENHQMLDNNDGQQNAGQQCDEEGILSGNPIGRSPSAWAVQLSSVLSPRLQCFAARPAGGGDGAGEG